MMLDVDDVDEILDLLEDELFDYGFEFHPFKVGWYNSLVGEPFRLHVDDDVLALVVLSTPRMFENAFLPFLRDRRGDLCDLTDPIDLCMRSCMTHVAELLEKYEVDIIHDFEFHPDRRPKAIMQSAAHASGAAFFYHPDQLDISITSEKKMFGVCVHPRYGGWFAIRAVILLRGATCPRLPRVYPLDLLPTLSEKLHLLRLYNDDWRDWKFRDVVPVVEKYSEMQMKYFSTPPGCRRHIIEELADRRPAETVGSMRWP